MRNRMSNREWWMWFGVLLIIVAGMGLLVFKWPVLAWLTPGVAGAVLVWIKRQKLGV